MQRSFFRTAYKDGTAMWDIPVPQPAIVMLAAQGELEGPVLDLGCGTGENGLFLDLLGFDVVGIDRERRAVTLAQEKAERCKARALFLVDDALKPVVPRGWARTVIDAAFFHGLSARERKRYWRTAAEALRPGGRLHILSFDDPLMRRQLREAPAVLRGPSLRPAYFLLRGDSACDAEAAVLATYRKAGPAPRPPRPKRRSKGARA
jgi:SAM-dependent methyltransferase